VGPAGRIAVRRSHRTLQLAGGTTIRFGDRIGILHLNNAFMAAVHADGNAPIVVGLEFRRQLVSSLHELARLAGPSGRLKDVKAFSATTIFFHQGFTRLGFAPEDDAPAWPRLVAAYQRALLASLHPAGPVCLRRSVTAALRLWISRENLLARYGAVARPAQRDEQISSDVQYFGRRPALRRMDGTFPRGPTKMPARTLKMMVAMAICTARAAAGRTAGGGRRARGVDPVHDDEDAEGPDRERRASMRGSSAGAPRDFAGLLGLRPMAAG